MKRVGLVVLSKDTTELKFGAEKLTSSLDRAGICCLAVMAAEKLSPVGRQDRQYALSGTFRRVGR